MNEDKEGLMPEEVHPSKKDDGPNDLSDAIVLRIADDIEDARTLRDKRTHLFKWFARGTAVFLLLLVLFIVAIIWCPRASLLPIHAPTVAITILIVLAAIPTFLIVSIARAVFGRKTQSESPFTPIHALIQLIKDMRS